MANLTTDGKICIERELDISSRANNYDDIIKEFDVIETCTWISENNFERVCLQFSDDLLHVSPKLYKEIKDRTNADVYILGDTSYASCCVDAVAAMHVDGEAIVHYGHTCFTKTTIPVFIVLPKRELDIVAAENMFKNFTEHTNLCLFYDTKYEHCKDTFARIWYQQYPQSYIAEISLTEKTNRFCGRVITNKDKNEFPVEAIKDCVCVFLGSNNQSLFNFTITVEATKWYHIDPEENSVVSLNETMWFKRRRFLVEKCKDANTVGILICKLAGEQTKDIIQRMKKLCKINGKKSYIVSVGKPNVPKLANFPEIDIYVMIACPENDLYSNRDFYKPLIYPFELELALNSKRNLYTNYHVTDYDELLPGKKHYCDIEEIKETTDVSLITGKIREMKTQTFEDDNMDLVEKKNWALESIGSNLQERSWQGLEQKLGETKVEKVTEGRKGIPLQYNNEPK